MENMKAEVKIFEAPNEDMKEKNTIQEIFESPDYGEGFTEIEIYFIQHAIWEEQEWLIEQVENKIKSNTDNRARILYEIADMFKREIVEPDKGYIYENNQALLNEHKPYKWVLLSAISSVDNFKIAEELLRQYEEYTAKKSAA